MSALDQYFLSSEDKKFLISFINILQKRGNKQRALSSMCSLFSQLKLGLAGFPIVDKYPLDTLDEKNPIQIIRKGLYNLKPAFLIRRIIKSGKRYDLPVPISDKRANFMALDWLRKTVLKNNKNDLSFTSLLAREISATLYHEGSAQAFLKAYVDIALDQRPFSRFIKKRAYTVSKSKRTVVATRLGKLHDAIRQTLRARKYRSVGITRKINMHNIRSGSKLYLKERKKKVIKPKRKYFIRNKRNKRK